MHIVWATALRVPIALLYTRLPEKLQRTGHRPLQSTFGSVGIETWALRAVIGGGPAAERPICWKAEGEHIADPDRTALVSLREVTPETLAMIVELSVAPSQQAFVASNAKSIAEAYFHPEAWFRAIYANDEPVGFLMLHDEHLLKSPRERGFYYLWRFMVDLRFQRQGYGTRAIQALISHVRERPHATRLLTSCLPGQGSPLDFYLSSGFSATGRQVDGEIELERSLAGSSLAAGL